MALRGVLFPPPLEYDGSRRDVGDEEDGNRTETDDEGLIRSANVVSTASSVDLILHLGEMYSERNVGVETETETEDGEGGAIEEEDSDDDSDDYYDDDSDDSDDGEDGSDDHTQEEGEDEDEEENKGRVDNGEEKGKDDTVVVSGDDLVLPTCPICFDAWTSEGPHRICCTPCGHVYGRLCLEIWLSKFDYKGKCPQCKGKFKRSQIINLYAPRIVVPNDDLEKEVASLREKIELLTLEKAKLIENLHKQTDQGVYGGHALDLRTASVLAEDGASNVWHISQDNFPPLPSLTE